MIRKNFLLGSILFLFCLTGALGQSQNPANDEAAYKRIVTERAAKIVATLGITDLAKSARVQEKIARQYEQLNGLHDRRKTALKQLKETSSSETLEVNKTKLETETSAELKTLHDAYLTALKVDLDDQQIEQVKDGMTYGVLPITYKGYQSMLPDLTEEQKKQILAYLTEARERAMDEGTSKEKHAMFGKYKGRINNYLSAAGIDMKKASKEWEARIAQEAESRKKQ